MQPVVLKIIWEYKKLWCLISIPSLASSAVETQVRLSSTTLPWIFLHHKLQTSQVKNIFNSSGFLTSKYFRNSKEISCRTFRLISIKTMQLRTRKSESNQNDCLNSSGYQTTSPKRLLLVFNYTTTLHCLTITEYLLHF